MAIEIEPVPAGLGAEDTELVESILRAEALHRSGVSMSKDHRRAVAGAKRLLNAKYGRVIFQDPLELPI
jgi:hypothetical protein